jgi:hypothetical protein
VCILYKIYIGINKHILGIYIAFHLFHRSPSIPDNVHRLKPGDIDVIGSLGDSLIAGNGALEEFAVGTFIEARGVSWCIGGQGNWRRFLTLPNILKVYKKIPKLFSFLFHINYGEESCVEEVTEL